MDLNQRLWDLWQIPEEDRAPAIKVLQTLYGKILQDPNNPKFRYFIQYIFLSYILPLSFLFIAKKLNFCYFAKSFCLSLHTQFYFLK